METNQTILTREVVVIDSQKKLGSVKALRVDAAAMAVSHYIVNNESTGSFLVLPFENAIAVGDTFLTVQNRDDFLAANDADSNKVLQNGYVLLQEQVFSKTGNALGAVKGFEFDAAQGTVTQILLEDGSAFAADCFIFFSPDFVFVEDGTPTAADIRLGANAEPAIEVAAVEVAAEEPVVEFVEMTLPLDEADAAAVPAPEEQASVSPAEAEVVEVIEPEIIIAETVDEDSITDEEIMDFLIGTTLQADVTSDDGLFQLLKGTVLTRAMIMEASDHDAILLLTINAEV